ncbi:ATP-binding protein [Yinghuangia sp. YIM S09857]|uniref:sensor histidine kinase n=1 Tax=Yinghuangia sp. YIM S09857 TaxID=3436929 RepID=UPI003F52F120
MVRVGSPPEPSRPVPVGTAWLLPTVLSAAASAAVVALADADARLVLGVCLAVATGAIAAATAVAGRRGARIRQLTRQLDTEAAAQHHRHQGESETLRGYLVAQGAAQQRLTDEMLPKTILRLKQGESAREIIHELARTDDHFPGVTAEFAASQRTVLRLVAEAVEAEEDLRDSAQRAFVNIARRVQAIVHQQATDLREMEERHGAQPDVFGDLLRLDHGTALIGRLADSIAVLGGARPGRQWQNNVPLYSVLRGAVSRITDYPRVELTAVTEVAVVGSSVEPLIHALAELLDNATRYSPPKTFVRVSASEVQSGVAVEIEDGGIGLSEEARRRVERLLEEASAGLDLADLGESPRLGLAVVGRLAQEHNFRVALRPSAYGGVRAILVIPKELLTTAPVSMVAGAAPGLEALPAARTVSSGPARSTAPPVVESAPRGRTANGLPQRQRRSPASPPRLVPPVRTPGASDAAPGGGAGRPAPGAGARPPASAQADSASPSIDSAPEPGLWLAAFHGAVTGDSAAPTAEGGTGSADALDGTPKSEGER